MNSKKLKNLRRIIYRVCGHLPVRQLLTPTVVREVPDYLAPLGLDGLPKLAQYLHPLPATNSPDTQRGRYRAAKKVAPQFAY